MNLLLSEADSRCIWPCQQSLLLFRSDSVGSLLENLRNCWRDLGATRTLHPPWLRYLENWRAWVEAWQPPMHSRCGGSRRRACSSLGSSRRWLLWWADYIVGDIRLGEEARDEVIRGGCFCLVWDSFILILPCIFLHSWLYRFFHRPMSKQLLWYILYSFWSLDHHCHIYIYSNFLVGDSFLSGSYTKSRWRFNASAHEQVLIYHRLGRRCWLVKVTSCYLSRDPRQGPRTEESFWSYLIELAPINVAW